MQAVGSGYRALVQTAKAAFSCKPPWFGVPGWLTTQSPASRHEAIRIGISTPKADPSGDYAIEVFRKAGLISPGAQAALEEKALQLVGSASSAKPPAGHTAYGWHVAEGHADIFLTYCTNAVAAQKENPGQQIVASPAILAVGADYGLTVINTAPPAAQRLADFICQRRANDFCGLRLCDRQMNPMRGQRDRFMVLSQLIPSRTAAFFAN